MQAAVQYARIGGTLPLPALYFDIFYAGAVLYVFYLWIGMRGFNTGACAAGLPTAIDDDAGKGGLSLLLWLQSRSPTVASLAVSHPAASSEVPRLQARSGHREYQNSSEPRPCQ